MSIAKMSENGKCSSGIDSAASLVDMAGTMAEWIRTAAEDGLAFHEFESKWHEMIHQMADLGTGLFISQQGDGDLGETVTTDEGVTLHRSAAPVNRIWLACRSSIRRTSWEPSHGDAGLCLYSVDRYVRAEPADIVAALFRDQKDSGDCPPRPFP